MTNRYLRTVLAASFRPLLFLAVWGGSPAQAQTLPQTANAATNRAGTYTDLGTAGTVIATPNTDDANSSAVPIGFAFRFNGTSYTSFVLNTNGLLKLGTAAPAVADFITYAEENVGGPVSNPAATDLIMPFNTDLTAGSGGPTEYRVAVSGTAPNRVCTVQWKNVADKPMATSATDPTLQATQFANISFQVKLYEGSDAVAVVYGPGTGGVASGDAYKYVNVGIKGAGSANNQLILAQKASVSGWSTTVFLNAPYAGNTHNVRGSLPPDPGRTYTFGIAVPNDAGVAAIQGFGTVLTPAGSPVTLRAVVRNAGTTALRNITVNLDVTGANTATQSQVIPTLAVGNSTVVTFANVALPVVGSNTVTVSLPTADGNLTNNTLSQPMPTSASVFSYIVPSAGLFNGYGITPGNEGGFAAKFTFSQPKDIVSVSAYITDYAATPTAGRTVGQTVYAVVADALSGAILTRSPNYVVTAADANAVHTFNLTAPVTVPAGDVLAGMVVIAPAGVPQFYAMGVQNEDPTRPGTFFRIAGAASPPAAPTPAPAASNYRYMLEIGTAAPATCPTPSGITATNTAQSAATINFTGPPNGTGYQLLYGPTGFAPATGGTVVTVNASPYRLIGLAPGTCYDVYVKANCGPGDQSALAGPVNFCTPCAPPLINSYPYSQGFDVLSPGQDLPCGIVVADDNADAFTWTTESVVVQGVVNVPVTRNGSALAMVYQTNPDGVTEADDWFYLPAMAMRANTRYRLSFWYRNNSASAGLQEALEVKYGTAANAAAQTTTIWSNTAIATRTYALANQGSMPAVTDIVPATGVYYIGFHAISQPDRQFLAVDDVTVTGILATSDALVRAVQVYPNPSASGLFTLAISGANASSGLQVEVTNLLGQRVYAGTAHDNLRNELNISGLAAGIYSLKVKNGSEYMQQQLSIMK